MSRGSHPNYDNVPIIAGKAAAKSMGEHMEFVNKAPPITHEDIGRLAVLGDLVLVQLRQPPTRSEKGVLLPDIAQAKPTEGIVVAIGPGQHTQEGVRIPSEVRAGDHVRFMESAFNPITIRGRVLLLMREVDIVGVFPPEAVEAS